MSGNAGVLKSAAWREMEPGATYARLRDAYDRDGGLHVAARRDVLQALRSMLTAHADDFAQAISADFGIRSRHETLLTEVSLLIQAVDYTIPRLARWAAPSRIRFGFPYWPATSQIVRQPRGIAAIIAPGNYPLQLALMPVISAIAAGCRVLVKPSDMTPQTAALIKSSLAAAVDPTALSAVCGDGALAAEITQLPLDILLFTGSQRVGREILGSAAGPLTPVILELGGKSPAIISRDADLGRAATALIAGKLLNAGQTCIAPDYVLVPREQMTDVIARLRAAAKKLYPTLEDYSGILSKSAFARLEMLEEGQDVVPLLDRPAAPPLYRPALVRAPSLDSAIMREEIFGPLLPLLPYDELDDAISIVRRLPTPLTLYWFGGRPGLREVLARTISGSVCVNETVLHAGIPAIPFGGAGASGMGRYHGRAGFESFTLERPVFHQSRWNITNLMRPPFGATAERILRGLLK